MKYAVWLLSTLWLTQATFCQDIRQQLDNLMAAYNKVNRFNGSVLVARKGEILLRKGYGLQDAKSHAMNDEKSIFQVYSITKSFTSTMIMKLVEEEKLSLTDKLSKFYPDFPKGDSITVEHLLTHTSGIYDYTRGNDMPDQTEASFIKFIQTKPLDFSPGSGWSYSNSGYWLLGFIIAKVTGMTYEEAMREYIFKPLHMKQTGFGFKNLVHKNKTTGYAVFTENTKKESIMYEAPGPYAAGAIYSSVGDLYKFHKALQDYTIIKKETLEKAYTAYKNNYGYGWIIGSFEGKQIVSHSGGAAGYRSNLARIPSENICIVILNNNENANVESITKNILKTILKNAYELPYEIMLDNKTLDAYTGAFRFEPFTLYLTKEDGKLAAQPSKQHKTILMARTENTFLVEDDGPQIEFIKNENGRFDSCIIKNGEKRMSGTRIYPAWGLLGTATSKGWDEKIPDIVFCEDSFTKGIWHLRNIDLKTGLIIFRLNNDWGYHYGDNDNDKMLDMYGKDIKVESGVYDITLDLTNPIKPTYILTKRDSSTDPKK